MKTNDLLKSCELRSRDKYATGSFLFQLICLSIEIG